MTATRSDLLERLEDLALGGTSFMLDGSLRLEDLRLGRAREVGVRMAARKPAELRLQGNKALLPTLFVLVANHDGLWLDVPSRRRTYLRPAGQPARASGGVARALVGFEPRDLLSALVPDPPAGDEEWALEERPAAYVLSATRCGEDGPRPSRRLTFGRERLDLLELELFDDDGRAVSRTSFLPARPGQWLPDRVRVERPFDQVAVAFEPKRARPAELADATFRFAPAEGREVVDLSAAETAVDAALAGDDDGDGTGDGGKP